MSQYELVKSTCLQQLLLWEDPEFPPLPQSIFYHNVPPCTFVWKRARELYANPKFMIDNNEKFDAVTGLFGERWLRSCFGILYQCKGIFSKVVPVEQSIDWGVYRFHFWWCGKWVEVLVDDRLPTVQGKLVFMHCKNSEQLWPALLEKAYAKLHGSYEALKYVYMLDGLADLMGSINEYLKFTDLPCAASLDNIMQTTSIITAHRSAGAAPTVHTVTNHIIEPGMNYRVFDVDKVDTFEGPVYLVLLAKTLFPGETKKSHFMLDQMKWSSIPPNERDRLQLRTEGFWMLYTDFISVFSRLIAIHLDFSVPITETTLLKKHKWHVNTHDGRWKIGVTAGGCRNHGNFFHVNPQIQISLTERDIVIIALNQHSIMEPKVIGFSVYQISDWLSEAVSSLEFFKSTKISVSSEYMNNRQVIGRFLLDAGYYLVIPTTFEPRKEGSFTLRIYSSKEVTMSVLDCAPQMLKAAIRKAPEKGSFDQYEAQFVQLADEHKTINAFELQELLENCLPNDYIRSCATLETCRKIVLSLHKNDLGRITLSDFRDLICSLKYWQTVFKSHAPDKMSVLRVEKFRDALREVGFLIPERALSLLVLKYMRKDGMLRFGDFVSAVLLLHRSFQMFFNNTSTNSVDVKLSFPEWLQSVLAC